MNEYKTTTNRWVYNRLRKEYLANNLSLCTFCGYHYGENQRGKWYGGYNNSKITYPNWKLVSKNKKQWMDKKLKKKIGKRRFEYFTFIF